MPITEQPGIPFGISVSVTSNIDGSQINSIPISVLLTPAAIEDDGVIAAVALPAECNVTIQCDLISGALDLDACQLDLPCPGNYSLVACTN